MLPLDGLTGLSFVLREKESAMRQTLDRALSDIGIGNLRVAMEVGATDAIVEMLGKGDHASFLPRFAVADDLRAGRLHRIKIRGLRIMRTLWIARTRSNLNNPVAEAFIELLRQPAAPGPTV
jgi:DNA-binding transcriptional LysR family regulator